MERRKDKFYVIPPAPKKYIPKKKSIFDYLNTTANVLGIILLIICLPLGIIMFSLFDLSKKVK